MHFAMSHLMVQVTVVLTMLPAALFFRWATHPWLQDAVASQPLALQFVEIVLVADFTQYWVHRAFHRVPWLWRLARGPPLVARRSTGWPDRACT